MIKQTTRTAPTTVATASLRRTITLFLSPSRFFLDLNRSRNPVLQALQDGMLLWTTLTAAIFLLTAYNLQAIRMSYLAFASITGQHDTSVAYLPWSQLAYPFYWSVIPLLLGSVRHGFLAILGESQRSFIKTQALALYASLPFSLAAGIAAILRAAHPCMPRNNTDALGCPQLLITVLLLVTGACLELNLWVRGLRRIYNQNCGRACLTYASPLLLILAISLSLFTSRIILLLWT